MMSAFNSYLLCSFGIGNEHAYVVAEQIKDYSERLREAMELTKGQQYIAAADKTAGLLEAAAASQEEEEVIIAAAAGDEEPPAAPVKKKSFWKKLWGRE